MKNADIIKGLPFYSWQCLTIILRTNTQINLVIKDDDCMQIFIRYLLLKLNSVDGFEKTGKFLLNKQLESLQIDSIQ